MDSRHVRLISGFTYIEVLVVVGLIALISSIGYLVDTSTFTRSTLDSERDTLLHTLLIDARRSALSNAVGEHHGVHIDADNREYIRFIGEQYDSSAEEVFRVPFQSRAITITTGGGDDIVFEPRSARILQGAGTITLTHGGSATRTITLYEHGGIDW